MEVTITTRASWHGDVKARLQRLATASVRSFFAYAEPVPESVRLVAYVAERGGDPKNLITVSIKPADGKNLSGLSVKVHTEGTQCLLCKIEIDGLTVKKMRKVIKEGPYNRKPKRAAVIDPVELELATEPETIVEEVAELAPSPETLGLEELAQQPAPLPLTKKVERLSPNQRLIAAGIDEEEIDRLRATMAHIVDQHRDPDGTIPNTIQVSVEAITRAAYEHAKLTPNATGTFRGIVANFYATRIALFGYKSGLRIDSDATYDDWAIDALLVIDFVGGLDQLAALTKARKAEIAERVTREKQLLETPPPTAEIVEEAVAQGFMLDAGLLDLAMQSLNALNAAKEELALAQKNADQLSLIVQRLQAEKAKADEDLVAAIEQLVVAEEKVKQFTLSEDVLEKIREAKRRLDQLFTGLGI